MKPFHLKVIVSSGRKNFRTSVNELHEIYSVLCGLKVFSLLMVCFTTESSITIMVPKNFYQLTRRCESLIKVVWLDHVVLVL